MNHPLARLERQQRKRWFWAWLVPTLLVMLILQIVGGPLQTPAAPRGIVSYEFAGTAERAAAILAGWDERVRVHAAFSLGFDYLFMPLYAMTIALGCLWAAERWRWRPLAGLGGVLAWGVWLAAALDAVENLALWQLLTGAVTDPWPVLAWWSALVKFILIGLGLLYILAGAIAGLERSRTGSAAA
ncbi:MAG: hypothetical protein RMN24_00375 [Anaerolineae bacterium]|nr:hypothetical protein [Caldilineales bacterium]MDW8267593.1 hypothetical protein [Anaerolineae bacterium]